MPTPKQLFNAVLNSDEALRSVTPNRELSPSQIAEPVISDPILRNTFIENLYNKYIMSEIINRIWKNKLAPLKRAGLDPYGNVIERARFNPANGLEYNDTDDNILTSTPPDVKVEYIKVNRQSKYPVSVKIPEIKQALMSYESFGNFTEGAIGSLYNGDNLDEYLLMKKVITDMASAGYLYTVNVTGGTGLDLTKMLIKYPKYFMYPSNNFNGYTKKYGEHPLTTWSTDPSDVVIIADIDTLTDVRVEELANAFNLSQVELITNIIEVDGFDNVSMKVEGETKTYEVKALVCDRQFFQCVDTLYEMDSFARADNLEVKTYLHHWETISGSLLENAVVIVEENISEDNTSEDNTGKVGD